MVYGITTNLYELPKIARIEITILRGARRLKFSSKLKSEYQDFSPKIWKTLVNFGYKKYLQRIYIDIDSKNRVTNQDLQLPIIIGLLESLAIIKLKNSIITSGAVSYEKLIPSDKVISKSIQRQAIPIKIPRSNEKIEVFLKRILLYPTQTIKYNYNWNYILKEFFPQCLTIDNRIDITRTPLTILRKIVPEIYKDLPIYMDLQQNMNKSKLEFIRSLPISNIIFANKETKIIDKNIKDILQVNAWRIEVPFSLS